MTEHNAQKTLVKPPRIILIDDDNDFRHALTQSLTLAKYDVDDFNQAEKALSELSKDDHTVVITDIRMPNMDGMAFLNHVLEIDPSFPVVLITGHGNISNAVEAMRAGAYDFIEKPFPIERLTSIIDRALDKRRLVLENRLLRNELVGQDNIKSNIVGSSAKMEKVRAQVRALSNAPVDVMLRGETGSGKEVIARALHDEGDRAGKPFVAINCGAIPSEMMESELFGHVAGAFTSANKKRIGKLQYADGGTVFLDEIESMPMELQIKLLRIIETRSLEPLGSNENIDIDVRFIAASKVDLEAASERNEFRSDLYYRLNVVTIFIPPLRERLDDIPELCKHFIQQSQSRYRQQIPPISAEDLHSFSSHHWPGNVRELRNIIDRISLGMWAGFNSTNLQAQEIENNSSDLHQKVIEYEAQLISAELQKNAGNMKKTYESLGISRKSLYDKIQKYGIEKPNKSS
ncbi:MAG: sigma-54-dependent transcriptional regulator [Arenicella sp.]